MQINFRRFYVIYKALSPLILHQLEFYLRCSMCLNLGRVWRVPRLPGWAGMARTSTKSSLVTSTSKMQSCNRALLCHNVQAMGLTRPGWKFQKLILFDFPEEVIWKISNCIQNCGKGNSTGSSLTSVTPSLQTLQPLFIHKHNFNWNGGDPAKCLPERGSWQSLNSWFHISCCSVWRLLLYLLQSHSWCWMRKLQCKALLGPRIIVWSSSSHRKYTTYWFNSLHKVDPCPTR